jgi:hypothetical protein
MYDLVGFQFEKDIHTDVRCPSNTLRFVFKISSNIASSRFHKSFKKSIMPIEMPKLIYYGYP